MVPPSDSLSTSHHAASRSSMLMIPIPAPTSNRRVSSCPTTLRKSPHAKPPTRRVQFSKDDEYIYVITRNEMSKEDVETLWFCKQEFRDMKKLSLATIRKLTKGQPLDSDEEPRGLDHKTSKGSRRRQRNRDNSLDAVLIEQDRQWERERSDPLFLAEVYRQSSAHCMLLASVTAEKDAEYVDKVVRRESDELENIDLDAEYVSAILLPSRATLLSDFSTTADQLDVIQELPTQNPILSAAA